jgi:hypothetical protein
MPSPVDTILSLRLVHPTIDPALISTELGMSADRSWIAWEPRTTPRGDILEGLRKESYWTRTLSEAKDADPGEQISVALDLLNSHADFLRQIRATGGRIMFYLSWGHDGDTGAVLSSALMLRMAELGIDLGINVLSAERLSLESVE